ncbi:MAG TPA: CU044_5270 family protein, partial [Nocardioides sp.]|nr:CU044_5270 family protein [Nocardioides sp.]
IADAPGVDAADTLEQLALAAERARSRTSASDVLHVVIEGWSIDKDFDPDPDSTITPTRTENWLYPDGRFRTRAHLGEPLTADGRGVPRSGRLDRGTTFSDEENEPAGSRDAQFFVDMPNTVDGVRDALLDDIECLDRRRGQERSWCLTDQIVNLSQTYAIPPDVMAGIWRVLAQEEGIRSLGTVKDRTGREAVALSFIWNGAPEYRAILLADPKTGQFVGFERILIKPSPSSPVKPPAIEEFFAIVAAERQ